MNKFAQVIATAAIAAIGYAGSTTAAFAQEATYDYPLAAKSSISRALVQAELAQAKREGFMRVWSTSYNHMAAAQSMRTRAQVQAEVRGADAAALVNLTGEDSGSFALSRPASRSTGTVIAGR